MEDEFGFVFWECQSKSFKQKHSGGSANSPLAGFCLPTVGGPREQGPNLTSSEAWIPGKGFAAVLQSVTFESRFEVEGRGVSQSEAVKGMGWVVGSIRTVTSCNRICVPITMFIHCYWYGRCRMLLLTHHYFYHITIFMY